MIPSLRPTWLDIDLDAIAANVRTLCMRARGAALMAVVKANAYGHGATVVARSALAAGASSLGVALVEEGVQLRKAGIGAPILVLGAITPRAAEAVAQHGLSQTVFDDATVRCLARAAMHANRRIDVHLKIDTGMGRIGVRDEREVLALAEAILAESSLRLAGLFTHFAAADAEDPGFTFSQNERFLSLAAAVRHRVPGVQLHAANSAATLRFSQTHHQMVRPGIALYLPPQLPSGPEGAANEVGTNLRQAMRWVTQAVYVKEIAPGESVSYGRLFVAERPTKVMTLPVGYADGYHRGIGGKGFALVRGQRVPVIGCVCMDQTMLDVTGVPGAAVGDEVVLLGRQGDGFIGAAEMGRWCGMIDYEIVLSPTERVPRRYKP